MPTFLPTKITVAGFYNWQADAVVIAQAYPFIFHLMWYIQHNNIIVMQVFVRPYQHNFWSLKGKATFKTNFPDLIVALPYYQNVLVKRLTMPPK